jgi:hypothetical protein
MKRDVVVAVIIFARGLYGMTVLGDFHAISAISPSI